MVSLKYISDMLNFQILSNSNLLCALNLELLYPAEKDLQSFDHRWQEFFASDLNNRHVFTRKGNIISYPHKFWVPEKDNGRYSLLILFGNPAPHSVMKDVYFAYEGNGVEHRFWKVFRELGFIDLFGNDKDVKNKFLSLEYNSPFRLGFEVLYTFPSTASKPKWSGVMGIERLFGKKAIEHILAFEKQRLKLVIDRFLGNGGAIIAMQKDAYNAFSNKEYNIKQAVSGRLISYYNDEVKIYGTPPTRWLYTDKMKNLLLKIKDDMAIQE